MAVNVLSTELKCCCKNPMTGFFRDGFCRTGGGDHGMHAACVVITKDFLEFSRSRGNDLSTPIPEYRFLGLKPGDRWCLCTARWHEAFLAGMAPKLVLEACDASMLEFLDLEDLRKFAATADEME